MLVFVCESVWFLLTNCYWPIEMYCWFHLETLNCSLYMIRAMSVLHFTLLCVFTSMPWIKWCISIKVWHTVAHAADMTHTVCSLMSVKEVQWSSENHEDSWADDAESQQWGLKSPECAQIIGLWHCSKSSSYAAELLSGHSNHSSFLYEQKPKRFTASNSTITQTIYSYPTPSTDCLLWLRNRKIRLDFKASFCLHMMWKWR